MKKKDDIIEIPFGAKDSELMKAEYTIPEGMEAIIDGNKVIIRKKESEDERIRKFLVELVSNDKFNGYGELYKERNVLYDDVLAYLEKQKDASKAIEAVERIDKYIDAHTANAHDMDDSNPDKKYYQGCEDALGKIAGILQDVYSDEKQKEQRPTPKFKIGDVVRDTNHNRQPVYRIVSMDRECYICESDDQSLGDRAVVHFTLDNPYLRLVKQKPAEWSEEDEEMLKQAIRCVNNSGKLEVSTDEIEDWLKSLRPQPHWKPREQ